MERSSKNREEIDDLNDETFGDGAVEGDWESSHYIMTGDTHGGKSPHLPSQRSDQHHQNTEELEADVATLKIKELWPSSSPQPNPFNSIWSSPDIPSRADSAKSSSLYPPAGSKVISLEDLEREIISSPSSTPDSSTTSPHPRPYPPSSSPSHMTSPPTHMVPPPIGMGQHPPPGLPHPLPPRGVPMMPWLHQRPPLRGFPFLPPPNVPILRPGGPGGQGHHPVMLHNFHQLQSHHPFNAPPPPPSSSSSSFPLHGPYPPIFNQFNLPPSMMARKSKRSEYLDEMRADGSGFMTQKEKDWVIKIQLVQLQTQDPDNEDYYYQNYRKKKSKITRHQSDSPTNNPLRHNDDAPSQTRPLPKFTSHAYKPKEFEGTLGKLTVSSILAPRKTIDIPDSSVKEVGGVPMDSYRKKKQSLIVIEMLYFEVLTLEDLERRSLSLEVSAERDELLVEKEVVARRIFALLKLKSIHEKSTKSDDIILQMIMSYRKGKRVIRRLLPYLNDDQAFAVVLGMIRNLPFLVKRDANDQVLPELLPPIRAVVSQLDLELANTFILALLDSTSSTSSTSPHLLRVCLSDFGACFLLSLLKCGQYWVSNPTEQTGEENEQTGEENVLLQERWGSLVKQLLSLLVPHQDHFDTTKTPTATSLLQFLNKISQ